MPRQAFTAPNVPTASGPYSACIRIGQMVWTAGQCGYLLDKTLVDSFEGQARQAFENLFAALAAGGCTEADVLSVNVFLANGDDFDRMNVVYRENFSEPYPVRTTVTVGLRPGVLFEVNAQAMVE